MTAQTIIADIQTLPDAERATVFAYIGRAMESDNSWIPVSFQQGMAEATAGKLIEMETVLSGAKPSPGRP